MGLVERAQDIYAGLRDRSRPTYELRQRMFDETLSPIKKEAAILELRRRWEKEGGLVDPNAVRRGILFRKHPKQATR